MTAVIIAIGKAIFVILTATFAAPFFHLGYKYFKADKHFYKTNRRLTCRGGSTWQGLINAWQGRVGIDLLPHESDAIRVGMEADLVAHRYLPRGTLRQERVLQLLR